MALELKKKQKSFLFELDAIEDITKKENDFCPLESWSACPTSTRQFSRRSSFDSAESTGTPNGFAVGRPTVLSTESNEDHHENWHVEVEHADIFGSGQKLFFSSLSSIIQISKSALPDEMPF